MTCKSSFRSTEVTVHSAQRTNQFVLLKKLFVCLDATQRVGTLCGQDGKLLKYARSWSRWHI